jgi:hypothetical protein
MANKKQLELELKETKLLNALNNVDDVDDVDVDGAVSSGTMGLPSRNRAFPTTSGRA